MPYTLLPYLIYFLAITTSLLLMIFIMVIGLSIMRLHRLQIMQVAPVRPIYAGAIIRETTQKKSSSIAPNTSVHPQPVALHLQVVTTHHSIVKALTFRIEPDVLLPQPGEIQRLTQSIGGPKPASDVAAS